MSFADEFYALRKKKKEEEEKEKKSSGKKSSGGSFEEQFYALQNKKAVEEIKTSPKKNRKTTNIKSFNGALDVVTKEEEKDEDIAPVGSKKKNLFERIGAYSYGGLTPNGDGTYSYDDEKRKAALEDDDDRTWFQKSGLWDDGYQLGDVSKAILAGGTDIMENVGAGILGMGEKFVDAATWLGAWSYGGLTPNQYGGYNYSAEQREKDRKEAADFISEDLYNEREIAKKLITNPNEKVYGIDVEADSVFGEKTDALAQSAGQLGATAALSAAGIPFWVTTGITSFGGEVEQAFNEGATFNEAGVSGVIAAGAEILTEKIGGISFGGKTLTDFAVKRLTTGISSKATKTLVKMGFDAAGEGFEEILSGVLGAIGQKITYQKDKELNELFSSEEAWESFIGGAVLGGGSNVTGIAKQAVTGEDIVTGLSKNEQKVVDQLYNEEIARREESGEKLTLKEKEKLHDSIVEKMEKGEISTDMLEEMFGGETYKTFRDTVDKENAALKEISELYTGEELQQQIDDFMKNSESVKLKTKLSEEVSTLLKGDRLVESYNERARRGQKFEADLSQYDSKYHATIQNAINSGVMNNTRRSHEFVDLIAKISADKGITFDFANNAKIKESGFAVEGKTVNGYVTESGITLNVESPQYLNTTVGHEITHVLEGTELYNEFRDLVFEYAKGRKVKNGRFANEYMERLYDARQRYKDIDGYQGVDGFEKIKNEVAADLVGEYLFHDTDFIRNLSVSNRNVFQKMWDEIKYLCKVATAGSKEARELERVKKAFEEAYRESGKATSDTKYSLSEDAVSQKVTSELSKNFYDNYEAWGFRVDNYDYAVGDAVNNSHELYQDAEYDDDGELINPEGEGPYKGFYDAGELDGASSVGINTDTLDGFDRRVAEALKKSKAYPGRYLYLISGDFSNGGSDAGESIIHNPVVRGKYRINKDGTYTEVGDAKYSLSDSSGRQLTKEQQDYFKDSKMRDENGNLKVMYHGSENAGFHVFDASMSDDGTSLFFVDRNDVAASYSGTTETYEAKTIRTPEDMNNFLEEIGYDHYEAVERNGKFELLENNEHITTKDTMQEIYEEFCWYEGVGDGDANYKVYLNLTNPLEVDAGGRNWNNVSREFSQEIADRYHSLTAEERDALVDLAEWGEYGIFKDEMLEAAKNGASALASAYEKLGGANANLYDAFSIASEDFSEESIRQFAMKQMNTRDYAQRAKEQGYDGVIFKNIHDNGGYSNGSEGASTVAIAFDSNQVKSVANSQPTADPDIRYSLSNPQTEKDYMAAVEKGDTETAQAIVVDVGKEAGFTVRAYHGTQRADRVGNVFLPERATSGPMAFFTDSHEIAENYSKSKADTSMAYDPDYDRYETQFRIKTKYNDMPLYRAWGYLPFDARNRITKKAGQLREDWDGDGELMLDPDTNEANGGFQWQLKEARGNAIQALIEQWLNSGNLFNEESRFLDVLEMTGVTEEFKKIGMDSLYFKDPNAKHEKVYDTLLKINNPFDTADVDEQFIADLEAWYEEQDQDQYVRENMESDLWDKNGIDAYDFAERLRSDLERNTTHAWTSIPDSVTDYLKHLGYDGIKDTGGKNGGDSHTVWIPFSSEQVKSADPVTYDDAGNVIPLSERFNPEKVDIRYSLSREGEAPVRRGNYNVSGKEVMLADEAPVLNVPVAKNATTTEAAPVAPVPVAENATVAEKETVAPVKEKAEAIRPKPQKEPRMARATPEEQARAQILTEEPESPKQKGKNWQKAKREFIDPGTVFEKLALKKGNRELQGRYSAIRRANRRAQRFMAKGLDPIRQTVEQSGKTQQFSEYMYHLLNTDRMTLAERYDDVENKPVFGDSVTAEMSRGIAAELEKANPEFKKWAQDVYSYMTTLRGMMVENGIISAETAQLWQEMYPHYVPIRRVGHDGVNINVPLDTGRTGINAPIKKATGGNSDILPMFDTMGTRTIQTFKAVAKNRFGVELKNTLGKPGERGAASLDEVIDSVDTHEELIKKGENGKPPTFTVFENGERVTFDITEEMYEAMQPAQGLSAFNSKVLNKANNVRRGLITEYNLMFTVTNAIKDAQDVLINSQHPIKTYAAFPQAFKELLTGKGTYVTEYLDNGGEDLTYFDDQTKTFKGDKSTLRKIVGFPLDKISDINNFIEKVPRLAEYIASRKDGRTVDVAMLDAARVTTDFSAGGHFVKMLNRNGFTFLNASVQGAVQQVRNVREARYNGLKGWAQLAGKVVAAGLPFMLLNHLLWDDDEEYADLSDYVKQSYYIVGKTEDGKFIRIPKGRALAVIQNAFQQMENLVTGNDEVDLAAFGQLVVDNLAPSNPLDNNLIAPLAQAFRNETWYGEDLVPTRLQSLPAEEQYDESTDSLSKWLGEKTGLSPYKINYVLDQYSGFVGDTFLPMMTPEAESGNDTFAGNMVAPWVDKFTTDPVFNNQNVSDFYDMKDELSITANGMNATDDDILASKYMNSINAELGKLYAAKREIQNDTTLSDSEKYAAVRDIQSQIVDLTKQSLDTYDDISYEEPHRGYDDEIAVVGDRYFTQNDEGEWSKMSDDAVLKYQITASAGDSNYATDGVHSYYWYEPDEDSTSEAGWRKVTDEQLKKQREVTKKFGISPKEYWSKKEEYDYAYKSPENYAVSKAVGGYEAFKTYSGELYDIKADKDKNGKSISGSRKEKVLDYINSLDIDYGEKLILFKNEYNADDTYNYEIINYLNSREDISFEDTITILRKLGFTVDSKGNITW